MKRKTFFIPFQILGNSQIIKKMDKTKATRNIKG